jgi:hypothetical protein
MKKLPRPDGIGREPRIPQRSTEAAIGIALAQIIELIIENIEEKRGVQDSAARAWRQTSSAHRERKAGPHGLIARLAPEML